MSSTDQNNVKVHIAVVGAVDAGKSSLIGTLASGKLDDGRGSSRRVILSHQHELASGRTSCVNTIAVPQPNDETNEIILIDLAGHEKYLKTTLRGLTTYLPKLAIVVINVNSGIGVTTKEHLKICRNLSIPFIIVVSKLDLAQSHEMIGDLHKDIKAKLRSMRLLHSYFILPVAIESASASDSAPTIVHCQLEQGRSSGIRIGAGNQNAHEAGEDAPKLSETVGNTLSIKNIFELFRINPHGICPVFNLSNKTGHGLAELKEFLNYIRMEVVLNKNLIGSNLGSTLSSFLEEKEISNFFSIIKYYNVPGVGHVFYGNNRKGVIHRGQTILIGPFYTSRADQIYTCSYKEIRVKNIRLDCTKHVIGAKPRNNNEFDVDVLDEDRYACINFTFVDNKVALARHFLSACSVVISKEFYIVDIKVEVCVIGSGIMVKKGCHPFVESDIMRCEGTIVYTEKRLNQDEILLANKQNMILLADPATRLLAKHVVNGHQERPLLIGDTGNLYIHFTKQKIFYPGQRILIRGGGNNNSIKLAGIVREVSSNMLGGFDNPNIKMDSMQNPVNMSKELESYLASLGTDVHKLANLVETCSGSTCSGAAAAVAGLVSNENFIINPFN